MLIYLHFKNNHTSLKQYRKNIDGSWKKEAKLLWVNQNAFIDSIKVQVKNLY